MLTCITYITYKNKSAINLIKLAFDANYSFKHQRKFSVNHESGREDNNIENFSDH